MQEHLDWNCHINNLISKLNRACGLLAKIRHYVPKYLLRTVYFSLFNSHLIYACQIWGQTNIKKLSNIQDKALRIINFKPPGSPINKLYHTSKILKINDYIQAINFMLVHKTISGDSLKIFDNFFTQANLTHNHGTRHATRNSVHLPHARTEQYGIHSIQYQCAVTWNRLQNQLTTNIFNKTASVIKKTRLSHTIL